jgi:AcrR family transcriptional regulator
MSKGRKVLTTEQVEVVRTQILDAARRLFAQKGYRSVSMRALAEATGMSPMALYRYFDGKRAILIHIWGDIFAELFGMCQATAATAATPEEALRRYVNRFVAYWLENPENYLMVYAEIDEPTGGESFFAQSDVVSAELGHIGHMLSACGVADEDIDVTLQRLICAMHGVCHSLVTIPEMRWLPAATLISGLVDGLLPNQ